MYGYEERIINLTFSPPELRKLADKMEREFPKMRAGDSTCVEAKILEPGLMIKAVKPMMIDLGRPAKKDLYIVSSLGDMR